MKFYRLTLFLMLLLLLSGCSAKSAQNQFKIENGLLDLRGYSADEYNTFRLDGNWEFYWNRFIDYRDLGRISPDLCGKVPLSWDHYQLHGRYLPGTGYASYRLHVITSLPKGTVLGLQIDTFSSAFDLYINNRKIAAAGNVSATPRGETGIYKPQAAIFEIPAREFDIIIHVSNFEYARGGFWASTYMGNAENIQELHDIFMGKEIFLAGIFFVSAAFYFILYLTKRELKFLLYFACFSLTKVVEIDTIGQFIIFHFLKNLEFRFYIIIWYSSILWAILFLIFYMNDLYRSRFSTIITRGFFIAFLFYQIYILVQRPVIYSKYVYFCDMISVAGALLTVLIILLGLRKDSKERWLNIISMLIMFATYTHDYLYWANIIYDRNGEWFYIGFTLFLLLQIIIQEMRFKTYHEHLAAMELSFLQAQIKPHFLYNSINTFISISYYDMDKARKLLTKFGEYLRRSFDFKRINQCVPLSQELELAKVYVDIEKERFEERLDVNFDVQADLTVQVPILVLQPVIENAVIHGVLPKVEGGHVNVSIKQDGKWFIFKVKDDGVGMEGSANNHFSKNGVGLFNIDSRLKKLYHKGIQIESTVGLGTEVTWFVPMSKGGSKK